MRAVRHGVSLAGGLAAGPGGSSLGCRPSFGWRAAVWVAPSRSAIRQPGPAAEARPPGQPYPRLRFGQTWAAAAAPSGVRPEATERSGLEVPVHSPYTHSNQLQHPLTPERRRARMEYRSSSADVPASNSCGPSPAAEERTLTCDFVASGVVDRLAAYDPVSRRGAGRGMSSLHEAFHESAPELVHGGDAQHKCWSSVVPPAGFEPALPPPETGRCGDRRRLLALPALPVRVLCLRCPPACCGSIHETSTASVLIGRVRDLRAREVSVVPKVGKRWRLAGLA